MIITVLSIFLSILFFILASIHIYWLFGGKWGIAGAIPTKTDGSPPYTPKKRDTLSVSLGLLAFSSNYFVQSGLIEFSSLDQIITVSNIVIPVIFTIRSVGDFKYVGFFKKIKHTKFGRLDTLLFSPLCLLIGIVGAFIAFSSS